jgi:hypothetical protein
MRLEEAFSLQFGETITAERAYELYWAGVISDQRAFRCPGEGCTAQVTCANLYALEQDLKVQPHYRPYGEHIKDCGNTVESAGSATGDGHHIAALDSDAPDVFHLSRPANHFVARTAAHTLGSIGASGKARSRISPSSVERGSRRRHHYSVSNLVSRWLRLRHEGRLDQESVHNGNETLTYQQLFKGVFKQDAEKYASVNLVYWGKVNVLRLSYGYRITFVSKMLAGGKPQRPSLLLRDKIIEQCPYRKRIIGKLDNAIKDDKSHCILFIYGAPEIVPDLDSATATKPYTRCFINFNVTNLDMIDVHQLTLFERLKAVKSPT